MIDRVSAEELYEIRARVFHSCIADTTRRQAWALSKITYEAIVETQARNAGLRTRSWPALKYGVTARRQVRSWRMSKFAKGHDAPEFTDLPLKPALFRGLDALGHVRMTPVQAHSLPALIDGRDLIAQAPTGSGKTAAFGLGLLHRIDSTHIALLALTLCMPRERSRATRLEQALLEQMPPPLCWKPVPLTRVQDAKAPSAPMATLRIDAGRSFRVRRL